MNLNFLKSFNAVKSAIVTAVVVLMAATAVIASGFAAEVHAAGTVGTLNGKSYSSFETMVKDLEKNYKNKTVTIEMTSSWNAAATDDFDRRLVIPSGCKATLNMHGNVFSRNNAWNNDWDSNGELICVESDASLTINGASTEAEKKKEYKNIAVFTSTSRDGKANGRKTMKGALLTGGDSTDGSGGLHIKANCTVIVNDVTIAGCKADRGWREAFGIKCGYGGGIFLKGEKTKLNLNNTVVTGCYSYYDGGGIYEGNYDNVEIRMDGSHVDGNFAGDDGGGINLDGEKLTLTGKNGSTVSGNQSADLCGGIYLWNDEVSVSGLAIENNKAPYGGGIYTVEETISLSHLTVRNNTATKQGGGIYIENDANTIDSCTITGNKGCGVYAKDGCDKDFIVCGNTVIKDNQGGNLTLKDDSSILRFTLVAGADVHIGYSSNPSSDNGYAITDIGSDWRKYLTADDSNYVITYSYRGVDSLGRRLRYVKKDKQSDARGYAITQVQHDQIKIKDSGPGVTGLTGAGGYSSGSEEYQLIKGCLHHEKADGGSDTDNIFYYTDGLFYGDPYVYNEHLATASFNLAMAGMYLRKGDYSYKHTGARQFLADIGCPDQNIYVNSSNVSKPGTDTIGVTIGSKNLQRVESGELKDTGDILIPITIRGGAYEAEWASNVTLGTGRDHSQVGIDEYRAMEALGFSDAAGLVCDCIDKYISRYDLEDAIAQGRVKFWVSGFSRAAATANITAKRLVEKYADGTEGKNNQVFAYPCEAPKGGTNAAELLSDKTKYYCIHNIINAADVVPYVAPWEMGFKRYGVDHYMPGTEAGEVTSETKTAERSSMGNTKVTTYCDNRKLDTKADKNGSQTATSALYETKRDIMVKQLATIDQNIYFDDFFYPIGLRKGILPYYLGKYNGSRLEDFLPALMACAQEWCVKNRAQYSANHPTIGDKKTASTIQEAARNYFGMTGDLIGGIESHAGKMWDAMHIFTTSGVSVADLIDDVIGEWGTLSPKEQDKYVSYLWTLANEAGAFDNLSQSERSQFEKDFPVLADAIFNYVDGDYGYDPSEKKPAWISDPEDAYMAYTLTLLVYSDQILSNHYPEVGLAWTRADDSFYTDDNGEPRENIEIGVNWVDSNNKNNRDGYSVDAPDAWACTASGEYEKLKEGTAKMNRFTGNQKIRLEVGELFGNSLEGAAGSTNGESIYYDLFDTSNGTQLASQKIYRGGIDLVTNGDLQQYMVKAYALSYGVKSSTVTYNITLDPDAPAPEEEKPVVEDVETLAEVPVLENGAGENEVIDAVEAAATVITSDGMSFHAPVEWTDAEPDQTEDALQETTWTVRGMTKMPDSVRLLDQEDAAVTAKVVVKAADAALPPEASITSGKYIADQFITLQTDEEGATIYFTTDGTDPAAGGEVYNGQEIPFVRDTLEADEDGVKSMILKACTRKDGKLNSIVAAYHYVFDNEIPVPDGEGREYNTLEQVFIPASSLYTITELKTVSGNGEARINENGEAVALNVGEYQAKLHLNDPEYEWVIPSNDDEQTEDLSERVSDGGPQELTTKEDQIVSFTVYPLNIRYADVSGITNRKYTGKPQLQKPVLSLPVLGPEAVLVEGRDYTYSIKNNVNVGKAVISIEGIGDCGGERSKVFKINPKGTKITKLGKGKKAVVVKWKKQSEKMKTSRITGYQVQVATNKKFTKNKKTVTVKDWKKTIKKITGLKAGKKYYIRVRTFKKTGGVKCCSAWSKVRSCKTGK